MADAEEEAVGEQERQSEEAEEAQAEGTAAPTEKGPAKPAPSPAEPGPSPAEPALLPAESAPSPAAVAPDNRWVSALNQFKMKRFFVLRPGTLHQAMEDIQALVDKEIDGPVQSIWLMAEVDHWNNEKERIVVITDNSLLVCKYDFVMFNCEQIQRVSLNFIDRISHGTFIFPKNSLLTREGEGVRLFWDRQREPSFTSRWNPFTADYPFMTFTYHPVKNASDKYSALCEIQSFREHLKAAAEKAHSTKPVPGRANGVLLLSQPILIEAYVGLMSFIGNQNKLGYCMARGNIGF
ncbi:tumor protein p63-regulated gene 1 protein isoform X2 [Genypterus blacodes]